MAFNNLTEGPAQDVRDIVLSDTTNQTVFDFRGFMVTGAGDVSIVTMSGTTVTIPNCATGTIYPIGVSRFRSTGTTATGIKGIV